VSPITWSARRFSAIILKKEPPPSICRSGISREADSAFVRRMTPRPSAIVTEADLERELAMVRSAAARGVAGLFGPKSVCWRLDREAAVFLGAGRALLLQLAHPWVAGGIAEHSQSLSDPIGRFQRTFNITLTMMFGGTAQAIAAARRLHRRHAAICGTLCESSGAYAAGSAYRANDIAALRWVWATLVETAPVAYELIAPALSADDRERYYAESLMFASLFGIPQDALPKSWADFAGYVDEMLGSDLLPVSGAARRIAAELFTGAGTGWRMPRWYRALTTQLLPPRLRQDFGLIYGPEARRSAKRAIAVLRCVYPWIPSALRHVAPYHEARSRLAGRARPGALTQALNRFWIGESSMTAGGS
jgi:uncharacterized protein (DUF2236 family)